MKKLIFLMIGILLIGSLFVSAEINEPDIKAITGNSRVSSVPLEPKDFNFWTWLNGIFGTGRAGFETIDQSICEVRYPQYRNTVEKFGDKDNKNVQYGGNCNVGEYIKLVACSDSGGFHCDQVFDDFYLKEYTDDLLRISQECDKLADGSTDGITNCNDRAWFRDKVYDTYVGYDCMVCEEVSQMDAEIISYNIPDESTYGELITVTAQVKFLGKGWYYVESGLRESSQTFSAVEMGRALSQCDGSPYYDGEMVYVGDEPYGTQVGDTESFTFNFIDYGLVADYKVDLVVANECYYSNPPANTIVNPNYKEFDSRTEWISIESGTEPQTEWACAVCRDNECKSITFNTPCSQIGEDTCTNDAECDDTIVKCYCGVCKNKECKSTLFTGDNCPCDDECTTNVDCGGTPDLAPTISNIEILSDTSKLRDGDQIKFKIEIKYPEGWELEKYANSIGAEETGALHLEVGVYDKEWAEEQGWIKEMQNWWDRAWSIRKMLKPCEEKEADFISAYTILKPRGLLTKDFTKCDSDSEYYDKDAKACYTTFSEAYQPMTATQWSEELGDLTVNVPTTSSLIGGNENTPNYNEKGEYWMIFGLYHDCGSYLPNENSKYKLDITIKPGGGSNGSGEIKQLSMTKSEWNDATHKMIIEAQCDYPHECAEREGFDVTCKGGDEVESRNKDSYGAETHYATRFGKWIWGSDKYASGTCRAKKQFDYCKFTEPLAFFEITGDECQDGLIILIGGLALLFLIPYFLGGGKK